MRDQLWLQNRFEGIWQKYFFDVVRKNDVNIKFGRRSKRQLGSIKFVDKFGKGLKIKRSPFYSLRKNREKPTNANTLITITSYFKDEAIPEFVVDTTIIHEICHYTHGFSSPLKQLYDHPHKGGVVRKELDKRGLLENDKLARKWLKDNWREYLRTHN